MLTMKRSAVDSHESAGPTEKFYERGELNSQRHGTMPAGAVRQRNKVLYENKYTRQQSRHKNCAEWGKDNEFTTINNILLSSDMTLYYFSNTDPLCRTHTHALNRRHCGAGQTAGFQARIVGKSAVWFNSCWQSAIQSDRQAGSHNWWRQLLAGEEAERHVPLYVSKYTKKGTRQQLGYVCD